MFNLFSSKSVRQAKDMCKQVRKLLAAQRDILPAPAIVGLETVLKETEAAIKSRATENALRDRMTALENAANKWLKPYPHSSIRENVEVLLVALSVAMAIRTFFLQPFKIPTGSMQPTLFGVTYEDLRSRGKPGPEPPGLMTRIYDACVYGTFYHYQVAEDDGEVVDIGPVKTFGLFINKSSITMEYPKRQTDRQVTYDFWFAPETKLEPDPRHRVPGVYLHQKFRKGEQIINFKDTAGDHVFVDRVTYNFRPPRRGEIIVFETKGPPISDDNQFYIKRLVALGDEKVQIGDDRHLIIDGKRLDAPTPHFENVYSFDPAQPAQTDHYSGHVNGRGLAPYFPDQNTVYQLPPNHYMVMGDNTLNSSDSRAWGDFSRTNVIGKYFCVYWPVSKRFGWVAR
jgi:signal peptidase I